MSQWLSYVSVAELFDWKQCQKIWQSRMTFPPQSAEQFWAGKRQRYWKCHRQLIQVSKILSFPENHRTVMQWHGPCDFDTRQKVHLISIFFWLWFWICRYWSLFSIYFSESYNYTPLLLARGVSFIIRWWRGVIWGWTKSWFSVKDGNI